MLRQRPRADQRRGPGPSPTSECAVASYDDVLDLLMVTQRVPAYISNRLNRLAQRPKRYITDPGPLGDVLASGAQGRGPVGVNSRPQLLHLRDANEEREVDLIVELADGSVVAILVKASAAPTRHGARHLRWLRDRRNADLSRTRHRPSRRR